MKISLIRPEQADIHAQLDRLKPAFAGNEDAAQQFARCCHQVMTRRASFYHLTGDGVSLRVVGEADGGEYFVSALAGNNLAAGLPVFIDAVASQGFDTLCGTAFRKGILRIYERAGFRVTGNCGTAKALCLDLRGKDGTQ